MFDNPKQALEALEEELLSVETKDEAFERFYADILAEYGEKEPEEDYLKDIVAEIPSLAEEGPNAYRDHARPAATPAPKKSDAPLVVVLCLEILGIAAIALWWIIRLF